MQIQSNHKRTVEELCRLIEKETLEDLSTIKDSGLENYCSRNQNYGLAPKSTGTFTKLFASVCMAGVLYCAGGLGYFCTIKPGNADWLGKHPEAIPMILINTPKMISDGIKYHMSNKSGNHF